jgi:hypothetical protein
VGTYLQAGMYAVPSFRAAQRKSDGLRLPAVQVRFAQQLNKVPGCVMNGRRVSLTKRTDHANT